GALGFWLTYWDPVIAGFNALVAWIDGTFGTHIGGALQGVWEAVRPIVETIAGAIADITDAARSVGALQDRVGNIDVSGMADSALSGISSFFGFGGGDAAPAPAGSTTTGSVAGGSAPAGAAAVPLAGPQRVDTGGTLNIRIDSDGRPHVTEARPNDRSSNWSIDTGLVMGMPG
ncbi:hypothetical protein SAMN06265365_15128, partial [Tistlia consotensis]